MKRSTGLYLIGGGGFAGEILDALHSAPAPLKEVVGLFDDDSRLRKGNTLGLPHLGTFADFFDRTPEGAEYILAVPETAERARLGRQFKPAGKLAITVIHAQACVSATAEIAAGSYIGAFAFIGSGAVVEECVIINVSTSVGHNARIMEYAQLCPGVRVSHHCQVGRGAFLGSNSGLAPCVKMGEYAQLAAGSFALRDLPAAKLAIGVPARVAMDVPCRPG